VLGRENERDGAAERVGAGEREGAAKLLEADRLGAERIGAAEREGRLDAERAGAADRNDRLGADRAPPEPLPPDLDPPPRGAANAPPTASIKVTAATNAVRMTRDLAHMVFAFRPYLRVQPPPVRQREVDDG
jgi:hypothetical protein